MSISERDRIVYKIHDFCRGDMMRGKGCAVCRLNHLNVCSEFVGKPHIPLNRLKKAEKIIDEVMKNVSV